MHLRLRARHLGVRHDRRRVVTGRVFEVPESPHSVLGPSSAERWLNCPGSVLATKGLPDQSSIYAVTGTAAHALSEWVRTEGKPAKEWLGDTLVVVRGDSRHNIVVDEPMVDSVQEFCDRVAEQPGEELIEALVRYESIVPGGFGTLDSGKLTDETLRITDFKDGQGVKKWAKMNPQLMTYAYGVFLDYGWMYPDLKRVVLAISQPRLDHYDEWELSLAELLEWVGSTLAPGAKLALTPGAPFKAGEWCQFCKIKATCKERAKSVFEQVTGDFVDLDVAVASVKGVAETVPLLTNEDVAKALTAWPSIEKWGAALKAYALHELAQGRAVGDMKLVEGRGSRAWDAEMSEVVSSMIEHGAKREDLFTEPELISPAKAEKLVPKKLFAPGTDTKEAGALARLVKKVHGKPTLVPGSDPRPAYHVDSTVDFSEVEGDE